MGKDLSLEFEVLQVFVDTEGYQFCGGFVPTRELFWGLMVPLRLARLTVRPHSPNSKGGRTWEKT